MQYRNAKYNQHGTIDCEVGHATLGWIPYTASPKDPEKHGRDLYAAILAQEPSIPAYDPPPSVKEYRLPDGTLVQNPDYAAPPYNLHKNTIWDRTTDEEAKTLDDALKAAPVKQRRKWDDAQYLDSADDLFAYLHDRMAQAFGEDRADTLLAPETRHAP